MSWSWSHSNEAYENGRRLLKLKSLTFLMEALAEWAATDWENPENGLYGQFDAVVYEQTFADLRKRDKEAAGVALSTRKEDMAEEIWEKAERLRTCTNGGHEAYVCPTGCHRIAW